MASEANFVTAVHGLRQRFAFQQRADYANGKAITRADGVYHVVDFNSCDGACSPLAVLNHAPSQPVLITTALTPRDR